MKNKKIVCGTILLLFVLIGICNIINVSAGEIEMPPTSYYAKGFDVDYQDKLEVSVSSSGIINVYIMNEDQYNILRDSDGLVWNYLKRWKDTTYLEYVYTIPADGIYYIVIYNKDVFYERTVDLQIDIDYYSNIDDEFIRNRNIFFFIILPIVIVIVIIIGIIIFKLPRRISKKKVIIQEEEIPKIIYCPECGTKIDKEKRYCSMCGNKISLN